MTSIREQTFKYYTIVNSFKDLGMWLLSTKAKIKKIRLYKKKRAIDKVDPEDNNPELLALPLTRPFKVWNCITIIRALRDCNLIKFFDNIV